MPTLNWTGKEAVEKHYKGVPYRLLEPIVKLSCGDIQSGNLLVQGDNLHALKALLPRYAGKVKCIYIDPPYNTGNEKWAYNDNVNSPEIRKWLGEIVKGENETLDRHDRWLCMMYPRLCLLKEFLRDDGVIFISIDDNEIGYLRLLLDEIFHERNFVAHITVNANPRGRQANTGMAVVHDHLLVYARKKEQVNLSGFSLDDEYISQFKHSDENGKCWRELGLRQRGADSKRSDREDMFFPIYVNPSSGQISLVQSEQFTEEVLPRKSDGSDGRWSWGAKKVDSDSNILYGRKVKRNGGFAYDIFYKDYLEKGVPRTLKAPTIFDYTDVNTEQGGVLLKQILGEKKFDYPKPLGLIYRILKVATDKDSLILDSFGGSGTTAHAVLKLNDEDNGNRKFILVEMDENIASNVTAERIKRVITGYKYIGKTRSVLFSQKLSFHTLTKGNTVAKMMEEIKDSNTHKFTKIKYEVNDGNIEVVGESAIVEKTVPLTGDFQFFKLSEAPLFMANGHIRSDVSFSQLAEFVWFSETGTGYIGKADSPLLGVFEGRAIYLLYNGILKDLTEQGGNILTKQVFDVLPRFEGVKVIYAAANRLGGKAKRENIVFKQTPYALEV